MTTASHDDNVAQSMGDQYATGEIIISEVHRTVFRATVAADQAGRQSTAGLALVIDTAQAIDAFSGQAEARFRRYREAAFLNDPYLAGIVRVGHIAAAPAATPAGQADSPDPAPGAPYLLMECPGEILSRYLEPRPNRPAPPLAELLRIATDVLRGLAYLHSQNFVYCALSPNSIWRVGGGWKLSDFSQLRLPGAESLDIGRRLLTQADISAPPEAYYGQVSTAWDVWSFGALLGKIARPTTKRTTGEPAPSPSTTRKFPPEIEDLIGACLNPDPLSRPTVPDLLATFETVELEPETHAFPGQPSTIEPAVAPLAAPAPVLATPISSTPANPLWRNVAALMAVAAALLLAFIWFRSRPAASPVAHSVPAASPALKPAAPQPAPIASAPPPTPIPVPVAQVPAVAAQRAVSKPQPRQQIARILQQWTRAARNRDVAAQMRLYAPVLDTYYGADQVTAAELAARKRRAFFEIGPVTQFTLSNLHFDRVGPASAVASFDRHWALGPGGSISGIARDQVVLRRFGNSWKIVSERELEPTPNAPRPSPIF